MARGTERNESCSNCGAKARVVRGSYKFTESGLSNVKLLGIELIKCSRCKNIDPIIPHMNGLMQCLAFAVAGKPCRLKGEEVRFLRKYLRMTGEQFASLLDVDKTTLSKWENDADPVGEQSDRLIRIVALSLGEGLKGRIEEMVRAFPEIEKEFRDVFFEMHPENQTYEYA
jgi:DNA-binding transcriptional regulator YiaG